MPFFLLNDNPNSSSELKCNFYEVFFSQYIIFFKARNTPELITRKTVTMTVNI